MKIGLIDVDSHNFPNLALMKLAAYHKGRGDSVSWWNGFEQYDRVYKSKVFSDLYTEDIDYCINADEVIKGGTGYDLKNKLPDEIEHYYPDYELYNIKDKAFGFLTRGCPRSCPFCIVSEKEGNTHTVADLSEFRTYEKLKRIRPILKKRGRQIRVYVLTNYNTTHEQDLERVYRLKELDYDPFVMIYNKPDAPDITKRLQRWCNNKFVFRSCEYFADYQKGNNGYT